MKGLDAGQGGRGLPKHTQIQEVGEGAEDPLPVWVGWHRPRHLHTNPEGGGGARAQRGFPPAGSPVLGVVNGDIMAEAPTLATTLRRGRRAQDQIGNRWGHRARPETPDPEGGEGREGRRRGGPTQAANPSRRCCPRAGLKTPRPERRGPAGPGSSGMWSRRGRDSDGGSRGWGGWGGGGGRLPHLSPSLADWDQFRH